MFYIGYVDDNTILLNVLSFASFSFTFLILYSIFFLCTSLLASGLMHNTFYYLYHTTCPLPLQGPLTIEEGAACPAYLALLPPNITEPKGAYLWHDKSLVDWTGKIPAPV